VQRTGVRISSDVAPGLKRKSFSTQHTRPRLSAERSASSGDGAYSRRLNSHLTYGDCRVAFESLHLPGNWDERYLDGTNGLSSKLPVAHSSIALE
jgi:hypothetical protein